MKTFETLYTALQNQSGDDSATMLTDFKQWINDTQLIVLAAPYKFLETTNDITTQANTARYSLFGNVRKIIKAVILDANGDVEYTPNIVDDPNFWEELQRSNSNSSDITQHIYQEGDDILLWPKFSTAGRTIRVRYRQRPIEMSRADYNTGTITAATSGSKTIEGGSTVWTGRQPVGQQWIRIAQTTGDYQWYRVATIDDADTLTLERPYQGTTFSAASASYKLAEAPLIPQEYHDLCFYRPMALFHMKIENTTMADHYWNLYDGGHELGRTTKPGGLLGRMIKEQSGTSDSAYYPPQGQGQPITVEDVARDRNATLG